MITKEEWDNRLKERLTKDEIDSLYWFNGIPLITDDIRERLEANGQVDWGWMYDEEHDVTVGRGWKDCGV